MEHKALISEINRLLTGRFGIPERSKEMPDPVDMIIATVLSQNTNDNNSYKAFLNLKRRYKNWNESLIAGQAEIESLIKVAGLARQKSAAIYNLLKVLSEKTGAISLDHLKEMNDQEALADLVRFPGVGVKTASCVLMFSLGRNICPVDTHLHRILNRVGLVKTSSPDKTFLAVNAAFPGDNIAHSFHTNLIKLGREICTPAKPGCGICPLEKICSFEGKSFLSKDKSKKKSFFLLDNVYREYPSEND